MNDTSDAHRSPVGRKQFPLQVYAVMVYCSMHGALLYIYTRDWTLRSDLLVTAALLLLLSLTLPTPLMRNGPLCGHSLGLCNHAPCLRH